MGMMGIVSPLITSTKNLSGVSVALYGPDCSIIILELITQTVSQFQINFPLLLFELKCLRLRADALE